MTTDCATCGHDEGEHTDGMSRGCDEYEMTWPRLVRCPCREYRDPQEGLVMEMPQEVPLTCPCGGATKNVEVEYGFEKQCKDCGELVYPTDNHRRRAAFDEMRELTADFNMGPPGEPQEGREQ